MNQSLRLDSFAPQAAGAGLKVETIETATALEALRPEWDALATRDPEADLFLSWDWLAAAFRLCPGRWRVLAVREGGRCVALLPLRVRTQWHPTLRAMQTDIADAGRLIWSETTGYLCEPAHEAASAAHLADALQQMHFAEFSMRYVAPLRRARLLMEALERRGLDCDWLGYRINGGATDNLVSPQVSLPDSFEAYLATRLSKNTRQKLRRLVRRGLDEGQYHVTESTPPTFDRDVEILLDFWCDKWRGEKGAARADSIARGYRTVLAAALELGVLYMPVLWHGQRPLAALGHVIDRPSGRAHFLVSGRREAQGEASYGTLLNAASIRWAIGQGLKFYDFGHGNEPYKYSFGAEDRPLAYFRARRPSSDPLARSIDPGATAEAMKRALALIKAGDSEAAARVCQQVLSDCS